MHLNKIAFISEKNTHILEAVRDQFDIFDKLKIKYIKIISMEDPYSLQEIERKILNFYKSFLKSYEFSEATRIITIQQERFSLDDESNCVYTPDGTKEFSNKLFIDYFTYVCLNQWENEDKDLL